MDITDALLKQVSGHPPRLGEPDTRDGATGLGAARAVALSVLLGAALYVLIGAVVYAVLR